MSTVKLPGTYRFYSQIQMQTGNQKYDVSLVKEFQHYLTKEHRKNGVFDQGKNNKLFMEIKWTDRQYHFQNNVDVSHKMVILGIDLCYNKFSRIGVKHQHYSENDTVCLSILFP